jgi:PAS domain S-box-containing protein
MKKGKSEDALEPHDITFQIIFEQSPISTQIFSPDGTLIKVNKAWEKLWQAKLKAIQGYNILKDKQLVEIKVMPLIEKAFEGKTVYLPPVRYEPSKTIAGVTEVDYRWTKGIMYPIKDKKGNVLKVILQHEDITEDKRKEDDLKVHYRVLESMVEGVSISNEEGIIVYTNPAEDKIFGYKRGELIGKHVSVQNAYPPKENKRIVSDVIKQLKLKGYWAGEWNNKKKDGTTFITSARITAIKIGEKNHWVCVQEDITERKRIENELKEREEHFRTSFEETAVGIVHTSMDGKWLRVNQTLCKMLGYSKEELLELNFQDITHPEDQKASLEAVKRLTSGSIPNYSFEKRYIRKDKSVLWVNLTISLVRDTKGKSKHFITVIEDITTRKKAEAELQNERQRIYHLFMQAPAMIAVVKGQDFVFELANPLYLKAVGKSESIIGKRLLEAFPELKGQPILKIIKNVYKTGDPFYGKELMVKLDINDDGAMEEVYFNFVYQPTYDAEGKIDGVMTHAIDVTPQVEARHKIEETENRFRTLADNIPNFAWMADATGYIYWYNRKWYEYTGTSPKDMEGWGWQKVHHPEMLPKVLKHWKRSIETGEPFNMVFPIRRADGVFRPFLTRVNPIMNEKGKVIRWFGTNTDITEQKELEKQKDEFMGIVSHELKTPVTSLKAFAQVLQKRFAKQGDENSALMLGKMDAQINKLTALIQDLLDMSRIEGDRLQFHNDFFYFDELVDEIIEEVQRTTERHTLVKEGRTKKTIYADKERIGQVIINFLTNAIKYSPHSDKIVIRSSVNKGELILSVQDFGVGIPKGNIPHIFERFYRVKGKTYDTVPGMGLGLYISSEIIKRQEGRIWAESKKGKGSTFYFALPLKPTKKTQKKNTLVKEEMKHE